MYPVRGQTVLLRTPWVQDMPTFKNSDDGAMPSYIIPRKGGDVCGFATLRSFSMFTAPVDYRWRDFSPG